MTSIAVFMTSQVCGLILIGAGIFLLVYKSDLLTYVYSMKLALPSAIIIITVGSAVLIPSFFGLCGAVKENKVLLIIVCIIVCHSNSLFVRVLRNPSK